MELQDTAFTVRNPLHCKSNGKVDDNEKIVSYFSPNSTPAAAIYGSLEYLSNIYGFQCSYNLGFDEYTDSDGLKITITHIQRQYYGLLDP